MLERSSELTTRQRAVIERIARRVPIKAIAAELGISPTRVNQHVRAVKDLYGVNSLNEVVESFREGAEPPAERDSPLETDAYAPFTLDALPKDQFPSGPIPSETAPRNDSAEFAFSDALSFTAEAPWTRQTEPAVVPGMLDGRHFVTARLLAMMGAAVGMMSLLVLVLTSLLSLGQMLGDRWHVPETNSSPAGELGGVEDVDAKSGQSGRVEN